MNRAQSRRLAKWEVKTYIYSVQLEIKSTSKFIPLQCKKLQLANSTLKFKQLAALCWTVDAQQNKVLRVTDLLNSSQRCCQVCELEAYYLPLKCFQKLL